MHLTDNLKNIKSYRQQITLLIFLKTVSLLSALRGTAFKSIIILHSRKLGHKISVQTSCLIIIQYLEHYAEKTPNEISMKNLLNLPLRAIFGWSWALHVYLNLECYFKSEIRITFWKSPKFEISLCLTNFRLSLTTVGSVICFSLMSYPGDNN